MKQPDLKFILSNYMVEARGLSAISQTDLFPQIVSLFDNIESHITQTDLVSTDDTNLNAMLNVNRIVKSRAYSPHLQKTFFMSHIAGCCELFEQWNLSIPILNNYPLFSEHINQKIAAEIIENPNKAFQYDSKAHSADTVRFIHILRLLGLFTRQSSACKQLSLGAGTGFKDIYSAHLTPSISTTYDDNTQTEELTFKTRHTKPHHVVLIDNDNNPAVVSKYKDYTTNDNDVLALNNTATNALVETIPELINSGKLQPFNLILGIRVDHRMIDNIPLFFKLIAHVIEHEADFIISIGAGFSLEEFQGRLDLMSGIFSYLSEINLNPVKFELYQGNSLQEQRESPSFGNPAIATHEMIHCKLIRSILLENNEV